MDVTPILTRLRGTLTGFVSIAAAADLDAAVEGAPNTPAAFVVPLAEALTEPEVMGSFHQRAMQTFSVVLVVSNLRDPTGAAAAVDLHAKRMAVRAALAGWVPDADNGEPVTAVEGNILKFENQRLWWRDVFRVTADYYWSP